MKTKMVAIAVCVTLFELNCGASGAPDGPAYSDDPHLKQSASLAQADVPECGRATLALDPVPAPPAPPEVPVLRHERRLRFLAVIGLQQSDFAAPYQRIARRCGASLDLLITPVPNGIFLPAHVNDQWDARSTDCVNPSDAELQTYGAHVRQDILTNAAGKYDVIFSHQVLPELQQYVEQGGIWVVDRDTFPDAASPLAPLWPAVRTSKVADYNGAYRTEAMELAGLPLDRLYSPKYALGELADGAEALAKGRTDAWGETGQTGATFIRRLGKGVLVFVPTDPISRVHNAIERFQRAYDHDDIWLRYWDQLLYGLVAGEQALPVLADLQLKEIEAASKGDYTVRGQIINRTTEGRTVRAGMRIVSPLGETVYEGAPQDVNLAPAETKAWATKVPVAAEWGGGLYAVYLTLADPATGKQIHEALGFLSVAGSVLLELTSDKPGYRLNEQARFRLQAQFTQPLGRAVPNVWEGEIRWGAYDFRGRLLGSGHQAVSLPRTPTTIPFSWTFSDQGVRVDTVWVVATAVQDGNEWGRAVCRVYKHERWDMRNEYQWSTWAPIACQPPCLAPQAMRLMAHAGFNALGYPAAPEFYYPAERWSWRMYNEGVGTNTDSPVINSVTDEEIAAAQDVPYALRGTDLQSGALAIASVGEEATFNRSGRTYYWEGPIAPDKACQAFQRFLREKYPTIEVLNAAWGTRYQTWDEIKLTKEFSTPVQEMGVDGLLHPTASPTGGAPGVTLAPYEVTMQFYAWYYNKVVEAAIKLLRDPSKQYYNPVPLTVTSVGGYPYAPPVLEVRAGLEANAIGGDSQWWSVETNGLDPAFTLNWGHFDWPAITENLFWHYLVARTGHNDYWVDIPLMFNVDMTHTRASFAIRRWRAHTAHAERLLLDTVPAASEAGVLGSTGWFLSMWPDCTVRLVKIALNQGGFGFADADPLDLNRYKIVFAVFRNSISQTEAEALAAYAQGGGTLVFTQRFAGLDEYGRSQKTVPGLGLSQKWGLTITGKNDALGTFLNLNMIDATFNSSMGPAFQGLKLAGLKDFKEQMLQNGWTTLATYGTDGGGTPAVLQRPIGKGRLVYLNFLPMTGPNNGVTPTDTARQGFYRLIEKLCLDAGAHRAFRIDGDLAQTLHMAAVQWTDPSGQIGYAVARTNGEVPLWTNGTLNWLGPQTTCYDVYGGDISQPAPVCGKAVPLQLRPGAGRLLAFTPAKVGSIHVGTTPASLVAGQPFEVKVDVLDAAGKPVGGKFPVHVQVATQTAEIAGLRRDLSLASGESVTIQTALNDPAGFWTITVRDSITRLIGTATVKVDTAAEAALAPAFQPWGQPSENWEPQRMPATEFIDKLKQLAEVYRKDHSGDNWMAKQWLGAYYCLFPGTRHDIIQTLVTADWLNYTDALKEAVKDGANLILVGEDLGLDPATGMTVWPESNCQQIETVAAALSGASWDTLSSDGEIVRAHLGNGSLVLCRNTPDGIGHTSDDAVAWQKLLLTALNKGLGASFAAPDVIRLRRWLAGQGTLVARPLTADWRGEWKQTIDPQANLIGPPFVLRLPPVGAATDLALGVSVTGQGKVKIDLGANGSVEAEIQAPGGTLATPWAKIITDYLAWRERVCGGVERDLNGWRLVPIRFIATNKVDVTIRSARVVLAPVASP